MAEREYSQEEIQRAADDAWSGGFGDFMFRDPRGFRTSRRRTSRRVMTSSRRTSSSRQTTSRQTSRRRTSRHTSRRRHTSRQRLCCTGWRNTPRGNQQTMSCWRDGNMWEFRIRNR